MFRFVWFLSVVLVFVQPALASEGERVVLLHGIGMSGASMRSVAGVLQEARYNVVSLSYPSTEKSITDIAQYLYETDLGEAFWDKDGAVHFVTHSMGGLVVRAYLDRYRDDIPAKKLGRVVMLAPPNKGSEVSDLIHELPPYDWFYGPAGQELTTEAQAENSAQPYYDLGVIAGRKEWPYFVAAFVTPGMSDGRVTVESTKLEGMADHTIVNGTHTFIMNKPEVHGLILSFIQNGVFDDEK